MPAFQDQPPLRLCGCTWVVPVRTHTLQIRSRGVVPPGGSSEIIKPVGRSTSRVSPTSAGSPVCRFRSRAAANLRRWAHRSILTRRVRMANGGFPRHALCSSHRRRARRYGGSVVRWHGGSKYVVRTTVRGLGGRTHPTGPGARCRRVIATFHHAGCWMLDVGRLGGEVNCACRCGLEGSARGV